MTDDRSHGAEAKSNSELEVEAEIPDHLGGSPQMRASAKVEIKKRDREAAEKLALQQLAIAERQATTGKWAALAAWGGASSLQCWLVLSVFGRLTISGRF